MKVLLAVDGSPFTRRILDYLATHPELFAAEVEFTALSVSLPITAGALSMLPKDFVHDYYEQQAAEVLDPVVAFAREQGWHLNTLARVGHPADVIAEVAKNYALLVMGSHGRTGLMKAFVGSVVSQVLARSMTPLLIIR